MRGGIGYQVNEIFNKSGIVQISKSKHAAKSAAIKAGAKTWADMGRSLAIYSFNTARSYKDTWHQFANFSKVKFNLRDIEQISPEHVQAYLEYRIACGVALATFVKEAAALGKLENALNLYSDNHKTGNHFNFRNTIRAKVKEARMILPIIDHHRAYPFADRIIGCIGNEKHRVATQIQLISGARIHEISLLKPEQMLGISKGDNKGEGYGKMKVKGKGGKIRDLFVSIEIYEKILNIIKTEGLFSFDKNQYRADLRRACENCGIEYNSSHGLRWTYAQNRMAGLQSDQNMTYEESLRIVSKELGHERPDITEHYLR